MVMYTTYCMDGDEMPGNEAIRGTAREHVTGTRAEDGR